MGFVPLPLPLAVSAGLLQPAIVIDVSYSAALPCTRLHVGWAAFKETTGCAMRKWDKTNHECLGAQHWADKQADCSKMVRMLMATLPDRGAREHMRLASNTQRAAVPRDPTVPHRMAGAVKRRSALLGKQDITGSPHTVAVHVSVRCRSGCKEDRAMPNHT